MTPIDAVRGVLGPMTSEAKAREVVLAVLRSVREPSEKSLEAGATGLLDSQWPGSDTTRVWERVVDSLIQELDT